MTRDLVEEIVTPGYIIDRGIYDNPNIIEENIKIREVPL